MIEDHNEAGDLIMDLLDGSASDEQLAELDERLVNDPAIADRLAAHARLTASLERIERERVGARDRQAPPGDHRIRIRVTAAAAACLAFILISYCLINRRDPGDGPVPSRTSSSSVNVRNTVPGVKIHRTGQEIPVVPGLRLAAGDVLSTGASQVTEIDFQEGKATVNVRENTRVAFHQINAEKRLQLDNGTIYVDVRPQHRAGFFVVGTPHAVADVKGTRFGMSVDGDITRLDVDEGVVRFMSKLDGSVIEVTSENRALAGTGDSRKHEKEKIQ